MSVWENVVLDNLPVNCDFFSKNNKPCPCSVQFVVFGFLKNDQFTMELEPILLAAL